VADDDVDFEILTNANQLAPPPPLRVEEVVLPGVKLKNGKAAKVFCHELTALEYDEFQDTGRVYDKTGALVSANIRNEDLRFLAFTVRDHHGNRIWHTVEACKAQLGQYGKSVTSRLMVAANKANFGDADAEGNSDGSSGGSEPTKSSPSPSS
jgi:hypothetical protein